MGVYSDRYVYGVSFILNNTDVFTETSDTKLILVQLQRVKEFYNTLTADEKDRVIIRFYMLCTSTYESSQQAQCMYWWPANKNELKKLFAMPV
jgi:hypothetical protein